MSETQEFIFYLQLTDELPQSFFALAEHLSRYEVTLVPVSPNDLTSFNEGSKHYLVAQITDLASYNRFREFRRRFLDVALLNRRFFLFHLSSFGPVVMADKVERLNTYYHYPMPLSYKLLGRSIAGLYYREKKQFQRWPGGRRSRLPSQVYSS